MAIYNSILKDNAYITVNDVAIWLDIRPEKVEVPPEPQTFDNGVEERIKKIEMIINSSTAQVESYIQNNVLAKQFTEIFDGQNNNVITPTRFPIISVDQVFIDYNGDFGPESEVQNIDYRIRGGADRRQSISDVNIRVIGEDIILRDSEGESIFSNILMASSYQSIKLVYTAGWGATPLDIPQDLWMATMLLIEYYYRLNESAEMNIIQKAVRGETYMRGNKGIPMEIREMLDAYVDMSFGGADRMQNNVFGF